MSPLVALRERVQTLLQPLELDHWLPTRDRKVGAGMLKLKRVNSSNLTRTVHLPDGNAAQIRACFIIPVKYRAYHTRRGQIAEERRTKILSRPVSDPSP